MEPYTIFNEEYQVLICRQHGFAISPNGIARHFRDEHDGISLETRQSLVTYSNTLTLLDPNIVAIPDHLVPAIYGLSVISGFQCNYEGCKELRSTSKSMSQHCKVNHKWMLSHGIRWTEQTFQTFFQGSNRK